MVWEGYTDTLFTRPFEEACGVKVNATYMGSSDDLVAKLRAGGAETIDLTSPSSDAATAIIDAGLAGPLDLARTRRPPPGVNTLGESGLAAASPASGTGQPTARNAQFDGSCGKPGLLILYPLPPQPSPTLPGR